MARTGAPDPTPLDAWLRGSTRLGSKEEPDFRWLLGALVTQLVALMLVRSEVLAEVVLSVSLATVGLATIPLLPPRVGIRIVHLVFCAVSVAFVWMRPETSGLLAYALGRLAMVLFVLTVATWTVWHLARARRVTTETLLGAVSGYLLLGLAFGTVFAVIEHAAPGSLRVGVAEMGIADVGDLLYFSFVTLTTVGYGDVTPVGGAAHLVAIFEAIMGQFYIAAIVARLISLQISGTRNTPTA
jgi:voltage-gated potassium channel